MPTRPTYPIRVDPDTGCWDWGWALEQGYGRCDGKLAHRMVWERRRGPIPEGKVLDHLCRNRACCNPLHLEPVTHTENCRRGAQAKLSMEKARAIRASNEGPAALARRYGVSVNAIHLVRRGRTWREEPTGRSWLEAPEDPRAT